MGVAPQHKNTGKTYLLLIAVDKYQSWEPLNNAVRDAKMIRDLLWQKYAFEQELTAELYDQEVTRDAILHEIEEISKKISSQDRLLIYYSGHGYVSENGDGSWIPFDAAKGSRRKHLKYSGLIEELSLVVCKHILILADACHSGSLILSGQFRGQSKNITIDKLENAPSRWAFCSGRSNDKVYDGNVGGHSPFAESLQKILEHNTDSLPLSKMALEVRDITALKYEELVTVNSITPVFGPLKMKIKGSRTDLTQQGEFIFYPKLKEGEFWGKQLDKGTAKAFQLYLSTYPQGKYVDIAQWKLVELENTKQAYQQFIQEYPKSEHVVAAKQKLQRFENLAYYLTTEKANLTAYANFLKEYPQSRYSNKLEELFWVAVRKDRSLDAYQKYLSVFPFGKYKDSALENKEDVEWRKIQNGGSLTEYLDFIQSYPQSIHIEEVKDKIRERTTELKDQLAPKAEQKEEKTVIEEKKETKVPKIIIPEKKVIIPPKKEEIKPIIEKPKEQPKSLATANKKTAKVEAKLSVEQEKESKDGRKRNKILAGILLLGLATFLGIWGIGKLNNTGNKGNDSGGIASDSTINNNDPNPTPDPPQPVAKSGSFTDARDGEVYKTVRIGNKNWMAENLRYNAPDSKRNPSNPNKAYGRLYDWATMMAIDQKYNEEEWGGSDQNHQGICPKGWHLPNDKEWRALEEAVGYKARALKANIGWADASNNDNKTKFSVLPAGYYSYDENDYMRFKTIAYFGSATEIDYESIDYHSFETNSNQIEHTEDVKHDKISCRCVGDRIYEDEVLFIEK